MAWGSLSDQPSRGMDAARLRPYVRHVNLLLLLSALLSAFTGVQTGARSPQATVAVVKVAEVAISGRAVRAAIAGRPAVPLPTMGMTSRATSDVELRLTPAAPLYLSRRRE